jgi:hypothetical protein
VKGLKCKVLGILYFFPWLVYAPNTNFHEGSHNKNFSKK